MGQQMLDANPAWHRRHLDSRRTLIADPQMRLLPSSTSWAMATAVQVLFIEPRLKRVSVVLGTEKVAIGQAPGLLTQYLVVAGDQNRPGEKTGPG